MRLVEGYVLILFNLLPRLRNIHISLFENLTIFELISTKMVLRERLKDTPKFYEKKLIIWKMAKRLFSIVQPCNMSMGIKCALVIKYCFIQFQSFNRFYVFLMDA